MTENDESETILEPMPTVTPLTGNESQPDAATLAAVCWLLRRYSSHAYIARASVLFRGVVDAFIAWPEAADRCSPEIARKWGQTLREHQAAFESGLQSLE